MPTRLLLAYNPRRHSPRPLILEDLLLLVEHDQQEAVNAMVDMLEDLHVSGLASRYAVKLKGIALWELKTRSRGGMKGGARVYFYPTADGNALVLNAEVKEGDKASAAKLKEALVIVQAFKNGVPVL